MIRLIILLSIVNIISCKQPENHCKISKNSNKKFTSYIDTIIYSPLNKYKKNIEIEVLGKYFYNDSIYISPLQDAIVRLKYVNKNKTSFTNKNGRTSFNIMTDKVNLFIRYFGYNSIKKEIKLQKNKDVFVKIVIGKK